MDTPFETGIHSTNSYQYMRAVAEVWSGRWWWAIALPVVTCFALGMALNIAFVFMAFIIAFLIVPVVIMFLYFYHAITPEARMAILNKRLRISPDSGIDVIYEPIGDDAPAPETEHVPWSDVTAIEYRDRDVMMHLSGSRYRFMLLPYEALGDTDRRRLFATLTGYPHHVTAYGSGLNNDMTKK